MLIRLAVLAAIALAVAGCATGSDPYMRPTAAATTPPADPTTPEWMKVQDYRHGGPVPPMERDRVVNEQPCTEGIALAAGNLKCK